MISRWFSSNGKCAQRFSLLWGMHGFYFHFVGAVGVSGVHAFPAARVLSACAKIRQAAAEWQPLVVCVCNKKRICVKELAPQASLLLLRRKFRSSRDWVGLFAWSLESKTEVLCKPRSRSLGINSSIVAFSQASKSTLRSAPQSVVLHRISTSTPRSKFFNTTLQRNALCEVIGQFLKPTLWDKTLSKAAGQAFISQHFEKDLESKPQVRLL